MREVSSIFKKFMLIRRKIKRKCKNQTLFKLSSSKCWIKRVELIKDRTMKWMKASKTKNNTKKEKKKVMMKMENKGFRCRRQFLKLNKDLHICKKW
jgi:hypothetical protein